MVAFSENHGIKVVSSSLIRRLLAFSRLCNFHFLGFQYMKVPGIHNMLPNIHAFRILEGIMTDEVQRKIPVEDNIEWVADDPKTAPNKFEFEEIFPEDLFTDIEIPGHVDWEVRIPGARQRICSAFKNGGFPMYQIAFEHMGLRLPFTDLEVAIFNHLELCPSQLHPNSLAFIRAFEIVATHLQLAPTISLFFHLFGIQRSRPRGNMTDKCGWVSLKQHKKFFEIFKESLRGFKDKWFVVRPITSEGWKTIIVRGPKLDDERNVVLGPDGKPIEVDCERFPFCWSTKHYAREAKKEFPPSLWEDREGNPICDEEGYQLSSKKYINTKALLKCATRTEAEDVLSDMKNTQLTLRKLQAEKKRREAGGTSSSTLNTSPQSSSSKSIDLTGEKRVPEGVPVEKRPPKVARTDAGGSSVTSMRISDVDQSILASMGPESIRNVVVESSVAVFKLLEVVTFLNGRECKYLLERDEARAHAKDFGERMSAIEKDLYSETKALKESQTTVTKLEKDLLDAKEEEERLKGKVVELKEQMSRLSLGPCRGGGREEAGSGGFKNALAQLQVLNPGIQLVTEGMDEMKEVRDGQIASPPLEEED
ncbi:hypothetical protein TSUD_375050 [Trifolium subterraneum]|uniref:Transposase (putative) gypsy type domain-containing protein n=1 Tax=Trifolium subterraneum TaxID=3900 RepID=A0A2Z6PAY3_TRISU|nr:hypothetical protein TSUD_375050 [Trifolium subterraneum]